MQFLSARGCSAESASSLLLGTANTEAGHSIQVFVSILFQYLNKQFLFFFLSKSKQTIFLTKVIKISVLPVMKMNQIQIHLRDYQEAGGEGMPSYS